MLVVPTSYSKPVTDIFGGLRVLLQKISTFLGRGLLTSLYEVSLRCMVTCSIHQLRNKVSEEHDILKKKELESGPKASHGYGGRFGVERDRMDKVSRKGEVCFRGKMMKSKGLACWCFHLKFVPNMVSIWALKENYLCAVRIFYSPPPPISTHKIQKAEKRVKTLGQLAFCDPG